MDSFNCDHLIQPCHSAGLCFTRRLIMGILYIPREKDVVGISLSN